MNLSPELREEEPKPINFYKTTLITIFSGFTSLRNLKLLYNVTEVKIRGFADTAGQ